MHLVILHASSVLCLVAPGVRPVTVHEVAAEVAVVHGFILEPRNAYAVLVLVLVLHGGWGGGEVHEGMDMDG